MNHLGKALRAYHMYRYPFKLYEIWIRLNILRSSWSIGNTWIRLNSLNCCWTRSRARRIIQIIFEFCVQIRFFLHFSLLLHANLRLTTIWSAFCFVMASVMKYSFNQLFYKNKIQETHQIFIVCHLWRSQKQIILNKQRLSISFPFLKWKKSRMNNWRIQINRRYAHFDNQMSKSGEPKNVHGDLWTMAYWWLLHWTTYFENCMFLKFMDEL